MAQPPFHQRSDLREIARRAMVDLMIGRVEKQLKAKDMTMELSDKAKALLAKRGFDPVLGARPLRRTSCLSCCQPRRPW